MYVSIAVVKLFTCSSSVIFKKANMEEREGSMRCNHHAQQKWARERGRARVVIAYKATVNGRDLIVS